MAAEATFVKTFLFPCCYLHHHILLGLAQKRVAQEFIPWYIMLWMDEILLRAMNFPLWLPTRVGCGRKGKTSFWMPWFWGIAEDPWVLCVLMWRRSGSAPQSHTPSGDDNFPVPARPCRQCLRSLNMLLPVTVVGIMFHSCMKSRIGQCTNGRLDLWRAIFLQGLH